MKAGAAELGAATAHGPTASLNWPKSLIADFYGLESHGQNALIHGFLKVAIHPYLKHLRPPAETWTDRGSATLPRWTSSRPDRTPPDDHLGPRPETMHVRRSPRCRKIPMSHGHVADGYVAWSDSAVPTAIYASADPSHEYTRRVISRADGGSHLARFAPHTKRCTAKHRSKPPPQQKDQHTHAPPPQTTNPTVR